MTIGTRRVVPLALAATRHPELVWLLEADLSDVRNGSAMHGRFVMRPFGTTAGQAAEPASRAAAELLARVGTAPVPMRLVVGSSRSAGALDSLCRSGAVQVVGFTPSDAAHVLGHQDTWDRRAALLGAMLGARLLEMRPPTPERSSAFAERVWHETVTRSARAVLDTALEIPATASPFLDAVCSGAAVIGSAKISMVPVVPVIAVGGPARVFYPEVGRRLGVDTVLPPSFEVANAVGAATGAVVRSVVVEVHGDGGGVFRVHGPSGVEVHGGAAAALCAAEAGASERARSDVQEMGADEPDVRLTVAKHHLPGRTDDAGLLLAVVTAEAVGRPRITA